MIPSRIIERKRDGLEIAPGELRAFFDAYLDGAVQDYQMAAFLMASFFQGLDVAETEVLVKAMLESGQVLDLSYLDGPRVDKHSTGGVGDKVSLVLAPLAAEMGLFVPMMSGRGLGHTAGTLDKLEAIPGFRTRMRLEEFHSVLRTVGCAMIGQTEEIAPLDRRLYSLRDVTGTVPILPVIAASIMSKKLAEGLSGLVLDVKVGSGAFIPEESRALDLARTMVGIGTGRDLPTVALLTAMDRPLGTAVGNGLETAEAIRCLRGEGPPDLTELVEVQAAEMLVVGRPGTDREDALMRVQAVLASGRALERFRRMVEAQGGDAAAVDDPDSLATAPERRVVTTAKGGRISAIEPRVLGQTVVTLGGGRRHVDEVIHLGVGFELTGRVGDQLQPGDPLGIVHALDDDGLDAGEQALRAAIRLDDGDETPRPLVSHRVSADEVATLA